MKRTNSRRLILLSSLLLIPVTLNYFSPVLIIAAGFEGIEGGAFFIWTGVFATSLAETKMEQDMLKKAAAYFAKRVKLKRVRRI